MIILRYRSIDMLKGICCLAVVLIHFLFPEPFAQPVKAMCRFAVPVFFCISGYFFTKDQIYTVHEAARKLKHILKVLLFAAVFYSLYTIVVNMIRSTPWRIGEFCTEKMSAGAIVKLLITNDPLVYSHLWFLLALAYIYMLALAVFSDGKRLLHPVVWGLVLLAGYSLLQEFGGVLHIRRSVQIPGSEKRLMLFNLYIFRALPFFLLGYSMNCERYRQFCKNLGKVIPIIIICAGLIVSAFENIWFGQVQYYVGSICVSWAMMTWAIGNPEGGNDVICYIGRRLSVYIYILHIAVGNMVGMIANKYLPNKQLIGWSIPVLTIAVSIYASCICSSICKNRL